ncbi:alpha/beta-hydrolase [Daldinia vernicosa]|uniref:alpha/beta-hydrolase n=1 Tax=Daldinia vernicosa TaxID=114800 RepID=UPI002008D2A1|nr:alpha/beta-hydrolase [Daldinia vernicosa]KAI0845052.1 alpha/beta-hydrolase [Daldinia vernicosa]
MMEMSEELFVSLPKGCKICYRTLGNPSDPAMIINSGYGMSMTQTPDAFVRLLNPPDHPHFIVQFDYRDTGRSTSFPEPPYGERAYTFDDMVDDIVGLINHLKLKRVHVIGTSMGGPISWLTAGRLPEIVESLALIFTSPVGRIQNETDNLPSLQMEGHYTLTDAFDPPTDRDDHEGWIKTYATMSLAMATKPPTEEERADARRMSEITYYRERETGTMWSKTNHSDAAGVRWPREALKLVKCPTVVIHGAKDQLFSVEHAKALRDGVEGATLVIIDDCGHELPHRALKPVTDAILANAKKGEQVKTAGK